MFFRHVNRWLTHVVYLAVISALLVRLYSEEKRTEDVYRLLWETDKLVKAGMEAKTTQSGWLRSRINSSFSNIDHGAKTIKNRCLRVRQTRLPAVWKG